MKKISGNKLLVKALKEEGVDTLYESNLAKAGSGTCP